MELPAAAKLDGLNIAKETAIVLLAQTQPLSVVLDNHMQTLQPPVGYLTRLIASSVFEGDG